MAIDADDDLDDQLVALGLAPGALAFAPDADEGFVVLEEGARAVTLFMACQTQWRRGGLQGALAGLDYAAARATADWLDLAADPSLLLDLRAMETGALAALAEGR